MTLDIRLRGYLEEEIDRFIENPRKYIDYARGVNAKNVSDFILGYFYGRVIQLGVAYAVRNEIPTSGSGGKDAAILIDRRSLEIIDAIQRELEKEGIGGNSI